MTPHTISMTWVFLLIFLYAIFVSDSTGTSRRDERRLLNDLLKDYDVDERPVENSTAILNVKLSMSYRQLLDLDEPTQTMRSLVWLKIIWKDIFLQWNPINYGNYSIIRIDPARIWKPDLTLYNNVNEGGGGLYNFETKISVTSTGEATWLAPSVTTSICTLDISKFPFDTQSCELQIGSWTHDGFAVDLNIGDTDDPDLSHLMKNTEWKLLSGVAIKHTNTYNCCAAPFHDITFTFNVRRKPLYYIMTIISPCVVLSLLASISFYFPADSGERISLVMSVLLGLIVFMLIVNEKTPINSESVPMITQYFNSIGLLILFSLLATATVLRMNHITKSLPVSGCLAKFRDFLTFVFCTGKERCHKRTQFDLGEVVLTNVEQRFTSREELNLVPTKKERTEEKILKELQKISKRLEEDELANSVKEDWKYTAKVLDKFFHFFFMVLFLGITIYFISFT